MRFLVYKNIVKEYELNERPAFHVWNKTDEALLYFIEGYIKREDISISEYMRRSGLTRTTFYEMKDVERGIIEPKERKKEIILRIAIHTDMNYPETKKVLALAGKAFEDNNVVDDTIIAWMYGEKRIVEKLRKLIEENCKNAKWSQKEIDHIIDVYNLVPGNKKEKKKKKNIDK